MLHEIHGHLDPELLETYASGHTDEDDTARVEEHLLICEECRSKLEETDRFVTAMKAGAAQLERSGGGRWRLILVLATAAGIILAISIGLRWKTSQPSVYPVNLVATRANLTASAPAGRSLELHPDLTGLPAISSYRLEMVDEAGNSVWHGYLSAPRTAVVVPGQSVGSYFVRVHTPAGELLREYGLQIGT
jgi:hypothetical protein